MGLLSNIFNTATGHGSDGTPPSATPIAAAPPPPMATPAATPAPTPAPTPGSQLDSFKDLWQTPTDKDGKPIVHVDPLSQPIYQFDPAKIQESAGKLNFINGIAPEKIQKALSGDTQAFADVLNEAIRGAVVGLTVNNGQIVNNAMAAHTQRLQQSLPTAIKRTQLSQQESDNPILQHDAVAPLIEALKLAEFNKNPNANPSDVHTKVVNYVVGLGKALTDTATQQQQNSGPKEHDWLEWSSK